MTRKQKSTTSKVVQEPIKTLPKKQVTTNAQKETTPNNFILNQPIVYIILILATFLAFAGGFGNGFTDWDDQTYITENALVLKPTFSNLLTLLKSEMAANYHPLTMFSLWLNAFLFGKGATSFIVTNTFIHVINTLLVFIFTKKLTKCEASPDNILLSFLVALFWGIHPMHIESVTWIAERKDVLYGMFFFLSCIQYINFLETNEKKYFTFSILFFILSCLSKGMAVSLPIVLFLIDYWYKANNTLTTSIRLSEIFNTKNIIQKIPFLLIAFAFGLLAIHVQAGGDLGGLIIRNAKQSAIGTTVLFSQKIIYGFYGFMVYLLKFFVPFHQHNFYGYPEIKDTYGVQYLTAPIWALGILAIAFLLRNKNKALFFGIFFFFITIVMVLQFISVGSAILAERYTYIPYFGLCFLVFYTLLEHYKIKPSTVVVGSSLVALLFIFLTYQQTKTYKNGETLFLESYKYEPTTPKINEFLTSYYGNNGNTDGIIKHGEILNTENLIDDHLSMFLANAYAQKGNYGKAEELYSRAIQKSPSDKLTSKYYNRATMYQNQQQYDKAIADFSNAIEAGNKNKVNIDAYYRYRGFSYLQLKNYTSAIEDFTKGINLKIALDTCYGLRAVARYSLGDKNGAIQALQDALKINPTNQEAKSNLEKLLQVK